MIKPGNQPKIVCARFDVSIVYIVCFLVPKPLFLSVYLRHVIVAHWSILIATRWRLCSLTAKKAVEF